jgi:methionyl aminopeptidase
MLNTHPAPGVSLDVLRAAGRIAAAARDAGAALIVPGAPVRDVCAFVDDEIVRRGGAPAFPTQSSRNHLAAHYCPAPEDETRYEAGDLAKLDVGVHIDGWVVDTALTVWVGHPGESHPLIDAAQAALEAAIAAAGPLVPVRRLSAAIERTLRGAGLRPMRNLCGHGVARWTVHCPPPIPNLAEDASDRLAIGAAVAIEPFATSGGGLVAEIGRAEVFRLDPLQDDEAGPSEPVLDAIRAFRGLPFARRQLARFERGLLERTLTRLLDAGLLHGYPPLAETTGAPVAQAEHTLFVGAEFVEVLTR